MAATSSFASRFPETKFRTAVRNTMRMGMPPDVADQLTWYWKRDKTFVPQDQAANPYDWTASPATDDPGNPDLPDTIDDSDQSFVVDYTLEFSARPATSTSTVLGEIDASRAVVTVFDVDYEKIKTADYAKIGETTYRIQMVEPTLGLFSVAMFTFILEAIDEA